MREKFDGPATAFLVFCHCHTFRTITGNFVLSIYFKLGDKYDIGINFVRVASVFHICVKFSFVLGEMTFQYVTFGLICNRKLLLAYFSPKPNTQKPWTKESHSRNNWSWATTTTHPSIYNVNNNKNTRYDNKWFCSFD